jgi:hypothetical protein
MIRGGVAWYVLMMMILSSFAAEVEWCVAVIIIDGEERGTNLLSAICCICPLYGDAVSSVQSTYAVYTHIFARTRWWETIGEHDMVALHWWYTCPHAHFTVCVSWYTPAVHCITVCGREFVR